MSIEAWRKLSCRNCHKRTDQIKTDRKNPKTGFAHAHDTARRHPNLWRGRSDARRLGRGPFGGAGDFPQPFMIIVPCHRLHGQDFPQWRRHFQASAVVDRGRGRHEQQDPVRRVASRCPAAPTGLKSRHEGHAPAATPIDLGVRLPLQRRTTRFPLCARAASAAAAAAACSSWWPDQSWSAIPAANMSAATITSAAMSACRSFCGRNWCKRSATRPGSGRSAAPRRCPN
jgi:hypothetical protein